MGTLHVYYDGYDPTWVLGRDKGPPVETKPKPTPAPAPKKEAGPVELKVPFCCEQCVENVHKRLIEVEGVDSVKIDTNMEKVTISGKMKPEDCLKEAKKVVRRSDLWPKKKEEKKEGGDAKKDDKKK